MDRNPGVQNSMKYRDVRTRRLIHSIQVSPSCHLLFKFSILAVIATCIAIIIAAVPPLPPPSSFQCQISVSVLPVSLLLSLLLLLCRCACVSVLPPSLLLLLLLCDSDICDAKLVQLALVAVHFDLTFPAVVLNVSWALHQNWWWQRLLHHRSWAHLQSCLHCCCSLLAFWYRQLSRYSYTEWGPS